MATKTLCILVVDDHHDTVEAFRLMLAHHGHHVTTAESFGDAVAIARVKLFDLAFCDIGLPEHDGFELMVRLKAMQPMRVVAVTGYGMPDEVKRIANAGFDDYLLKPVDFARLMTAVASLTVDIAHDRNRDEQSPDPDLRRSIGSDTIGGDVAFSTLFHEVESVRMRIENYRSSMPHLSRDTAVVMQIKMGALQKRLAEIEARSEKAAAIEDGDLQKGKRA